MQMNRRDFVTAIGAGLTLSATSKLSLAQDSGPIRIGALNPVTGAGSPYGTGMQKMILAAAETVNAAGGAAGPADPDFRRRQPDQSAGRACWRRRS